MRKTLLTLLLISTVVCAAVHDTDSYYYHKDEWAVVGFTPLICLIPVIPNAAFAGISLRDCFTTLMLNRQWQGPAFAMMAVELCQISLNTFCLYTIAFQLNNNGTKTDEWITYYLSSVLGNTALYAIKVWAKAGYGGKPSKPSPGVTLAPSLYISDNGPRLKLSCSIPIGALR